MDAKGWGGDLIIHIASEPISEPISCERVPALHPFVIPTRVVHVIKVVMLWSVRNGEIREIIRSCLGAKFAQNIQIKST